MRNLNLAPFGMLHIICCSRGDMHQSLRLLSLAAICGMVGTDVLPKTYVLFIVLTVFLGPRPGALPLGEHRNV